MRSDSGYTTSVWMDSTDTPELPRVTQDMRTNVCIVGAGIAGMTRLYRQVEIQAGITNLFDRNYILVDGYPEAGRMVYINMRYRF